MIKAVLFDLDQTLIDFMLLKRRASEKAALVMINAGLKLDRKKAGKQLFEFYLKDGIDGNTAFQNFIRKHNGKMNDRILAAGLNAYLDAKRHYLKPYKDVVPVLKKLRKRMKLGVVTDAPRLKAYQRLDAMGIADYFDFVVGFEDTGRQKPSSLPFRKALKKLNFKASEVLMVGDWPERDIKGARKVGMKTCFAKYGHWNEIKDSGADFEIERFEEILKVI
jgi:putative hydrolase of the HAD superfamily